MQLTQAQLEFNQDYAIIRERVVCGQQQNVNAVKLWIRSVGKKTRKKAEQEAREYYEKHMRQMRSPTGFEKEVMKDIHEEEDE